MTFPITRATAGAALTAAQHDGNLLSGGGFPTVAAMVADNTAWSTNDIITAAGHQYQVVPSGGDLLNANGKRLKVLPGPGGDWNFAAFKPVADGITDDWAVFMTALERVYNDGGDRGRLYLPTADYRIGQEVAIKIPVSIYGVGPGQAGTVAARLIFPVNTTGIILDGHASWHGDFMYKHHATTAAILADPLGYTGYYAGNALAGQWICATAEGVIYKILAAGASSSDHITVGGIKLANATAAQMRGFPDPEARADAAILEGFELIGEEGNFGSDLTKHGIRAQVRCTLRRMQVYYFSGDCIHIEAHSDNHVYYGNANNFLVDSCRAGFAGANGIYTAGYDGNAGNVIYCDALWNRRWGIWDDSFLGNAIIGCHSEVNGFVRVGEAVPTKTHMAIYGGNTYAAVPTASTGELEGTQPGTDATIWRLFKTGVAASNGLAWVNGANSGKFQSGGPYRSPGLSANGGVINCYAEGGQGPTWVGPSTIVINGTHGETNVFGEGEGDQLGKVGFLRMNAYNVISTCFVADQTFDTYGHRTSIALGGNAAVAQVMKMDCYLSGGANVGDWRFLGDTQGGDGWTWRDGLGGNTCPFKVTWASHPLPNLFVAEKLGLGGTENNTNTRVIEGATAAPTTGAHRRGDIVINRDSTAGGFIGWVCVTAGTPGIWKTWGVISA